MVELLTIDRGAGEGIARCARLLAVVLSRNNGCFALALLDFDRSLSGQVCLAEEPVSFEPATLHRNSLLMEHFARYPRRAVYYQTLIIVLP